MRDQFNLTGDFRGATLQIGTSNAGSRTLPESAVAWARFGELPLDSVPEHSALPPGSVMPWPPNPLFVARDHDLTTIAQSVAQRGSKANCRATALSGIGGIGKTQLAVEFAHRYGAYFLGGVYWISCRDPQSIATQVAACGCADAMDLRADFLELPVDARARLVAEAWRAPYPRLLIFDNCEDEKTLSQWRPLSGGSRLIITSRRAQWSAAMGIELQRIAVLPRESSIRLLGAGQSPAANAVSALDEIAGELGDLPLALHLAGSFLARYRYSPIGEPHHYLRNLRSLSLSHPSLEDGDWSPTGHEQHVAKTFELSYRQLVGTDSTDEGALSMLGQMACLAPGELIPRDMIQAYVQGRSEEQMLLAKEATIRRLADLGLIEDQGSELAMHRLISAYVQSKQGSEDVQGLVEDGFLVGLTAFNSGELSLSAPGTAWEVHLNHIVSVATRRASPLANALLAQSGRYFYNRGNYHAAIELQREHLSRVESNPPTNKAELCAALNDLAISLRPFRPSQTVDLLRRSLSVGLDEALADPEYLIVTYANLGWALGKAVEAARAFEAAISLLEKHAVEVPEDRQERWRAMHKKILSGLAQSYESSDRKRAQDLLEEALKGIDIERADAQDGMLLATLGAIRFRGGNAIGARESLEFALRVLEPYAADHSPLLADPLLMLGMAYQRLRQPSAARPVLERALELAETMVGPTHTHTLLAARTLGHVLIDLHEIPTAHALLKKTIQRLDASDKPDNTVLVELLFTYGLTSGELEGPAAARDRWTRALMIARKHNLRAPKKALTELLRQLDSRASQKR
jgi:tetratricopeptide (TPR) repeat protein